MAVRIIEDTERLEITIADSVFYYRRPTLKQQADAQNACTDATGKTDFLNLALMIVGDCLADWRNVINSDGNIVDFKKEVIGQLPGDAITRIFQEMMGSASTFKGETETELEGNLEST